METINGTISYIAGTSTKGIQLEETGNMWYNPIQDLKHLMPPDMIGKYVELKVNEGKIVDIKILDNVQKKESVEVQEEIVNKVQYLGEKSLNDLSEEPNYNHSIVNYTYTKKDYLRMKKIGMDEEKIGNMGLKYVSWAKAWDKLKEEYPNAKLTIHQNDNGMPYFHDQSGGVVKVSLEIKSVSHTVFLPIMDSKHNAKSVGDITARDITDSIQRAMVKAIAMHGMGLYVYKGEDLKQYE